MTIVEWRELNGICRHLNVTRSAFMKAAIRYAIVSYSTLPPDDPILAKLRPARKEAEFANALERIEHRLASLEIHMTGAATRAAAEPGFTQTAIAKVQRADQLGRNTVSDEHRAAVGKYAPHARENSFVDQGGKR